MLTLCGIGLFAVASHGAGPTFQELMDPSVFPEAQRGMVVESATVEEETLRVLTTGAGLTLDASGRAVFSQRIGHPREVVTVEIEGGLKGPPELTHTGPGLAFARYGDPRLDLRANGDSLFMFHAHDPVTVVIRRAIDVGFSASFQSSHLFLDEWGGFGIYCSEKGLGDAVDRFAPVVARYELPTNAVLWIGVCPPKPYDWEKSISDQVVWHWSRELGYPPDDQLIAWSKQGNIVLLQSEVMLWKDWNLGFEPRLGEVEFARVRRTIHDHGMRFIVYTSPFYFLRGTPLESRALNSFEDFTGWPPGRATGENIDLFMAEIAKVMKEYKPDGLYFDGQYFNNPAALYALARRTRALLGEEGILEWHSTTALGAGSSCYLPQADAYVDFILRGESRDSVYADFSYLRYFVSCYNASNSIGVICNNGPKPTAELVHRLLEANCRMHTLAGWLNDPKLVDILNNEYMARLTPALRTEVERGVDERQRHVAERAKAVAQEYHALQKSPAWGEPMLSESFDVMPGWEVSVSPLNAEPFVVEEGALAVTGKAHTYAYLTRPLEKPAKGLVVKLRQHTDRGMSWGPGVCLRWKNGGRLRVGVRTDGLIQSDTAGEQRLGGKHNREQWIWLRARWLAQSGVIERSDDGVDFQRLWTFDHGGALTGELENISIGKVPYNGEPKDHSAPGEVGTCLFDEFVVY